MISYCIPYFNNSDVLPRCLESIKRLHDINTVPYEIVIVDDHSDLSESKALTQLLETHCNELPVAVYRLQKNRGVTFAKNQAYLRSTGDWCVFIDSDDYFEEKEALLMLNDLRKLSNYSIVFFHCQCLGQEGAMKKGSRGKEIPFYLYLNEGTGGEALTVINKACVSVKPYYAILRGYEGLGILRLLFMGHKAYLSGLRPRVYTDDALNRLSVGEGFKSRMRLISIGHCLVIKRYLKYLKLVKLVKLLALSAIYRGCFFYNLFVIELKNKLKV